MFSHTLKIRRGFTLLELLVVVSLLASTAFIATMSMQGVAEDANDKLVLVEMQQIAKAIRQFKQDTGYYPKTGPFDLTNYNGNVPYGNLPNYASSNNNDAERDRWFYSPANFYQLINQTSPLAGTGHELASWNPATGRGWRGPYLTGFAEGYLDIRSGINDLAPTSAGYPLGNPVAGQNIPDVEGVADPFEHRARTVGGNTLLDWSAVPEGDERTRWGRPYLVFGLNENADIDGDDIGDGAGPWIVSMGPNGDYESTENTPSGDDIMLNID